jgi:hypothetical protein
VLIGNFTISFIFDSSLSLFEQISFQNGQSAKLDVSGESPSARDGSPTSFGSSRASFGSHSIQDCES